MYSLTSPNARVGIKKSPGTWTKRGVVSILLKDWPIQPSLYIIQRKPLPWKMAQDYLTKVWVETRAPCETVCTLTESIGNVREYRKVCIITKYCKEYLH